MSGAFEQFKSVRRRYASVSGLSRPFLTANQKSLVFFSLLVARLDGAERLFGRFEALSGAVRGERQAVRVGIRPVLVGHREALVGLYVEIPDLAEAKPGIHTFRRLPGKGYSESARPGMDTPMSIACCPLRSSPARSCVLAHRANGPDSSLFFQSANAALAAAESA